jgi:hypothetical protein
MPNTVGNVDSSDQRYPCQQGFPAREADGGDSASLEFFVRMAVRQILLDKCLLIFDNVRAHSKLQGETSDAYYSKTAKSVGLPQALF